MKLAGYLRLGAIGDQRFRVEKAQAPEARRASQPHRQSGGILYILD